MVRCNKKLNQEVTDLSSSEVIENDVIALHVTRQPPQCCFVCPQCAATIVILCIGETHNLINYVSFINYLSYGVTIAGLLYHRWTKPSLYRPIKVALLVRRCCSLLFASQLLQCVFFHPLPVLQVNLLVPVCYLMFWAVLLGFSLYSEPVVCGVGLVIMLTGVPVYFLGVHWKDKPKCIYRFIGRWRCSCDGWGGFTGHG